MLDAKIGLPSTDMLRMELEWIRADIVHHREAIARHRAGIALAERHFADSFDRLVESQKLLRRGDNRFGGPDQGEASSKRPGQPYRVPLRVDCSRRE